MRCYRPCAVVMFVVATSAPAGAQAVDATVKTVKVTVLSTMLAGNPGEGIGEWGFAALVEADGRRWLMDTGARADTVLRNAAELGVDLSSVTDVVITHNHGIEAVFRIREVVGLPRTRAAVGAVGSSFTLGSGLDPRQLAQ